VIIRIFQIQQGWTQGHYGTLFCPLHRTLGSTYSGHVSERRTCYSQSSVWDKENQIHKTQGTGELEMKVSSQQTHSSFCVIWVILVGMIPCNDRCYLTSWSIENSEWLLNAKSALTYAFSTLLIAGGWISPIGWICSVVSMVGAGRR
jgi:hypothetical protein